MKLKFKAKGTPQPNYQISGETINGIDLSVFPDGGKFVGDESTREAGIYHVERQDSELVVTLGQRGIAYEAPAASSDWRGDPELLIDVSEFDNEVCYITATKKPSNAVYKKTDHGWTVAYPDEEFTEESEEEDND